jgi:hypothetical protein
MINLEMNYKKQCIDGAWTIKKLASSIRKMAMKGIPISNYTR